MVPALIVFDLAEVLITGLLGIEEIISSKYNVPFTSVKKAVLSPSLKLFFQGKISENQYLESVHQFLHLQIPSDILKKLIRDNFKEIPGTREIIVTLKHKYPTVLLSVHASEWVEYCEETFPFSHLFDKCFWSFSSEYMKPQVESFIEVLEFMKTKPKHTLFIDDSINNVLSAQKIGIKCIQFKNSRQLKSDLNKLKILAT